MVKKGGVYQFSEFLKYPILVHGFSTRKIGDMSLSKKENRKKFFSELGILGGRVYLMKQVHEDKIIEIKKGSKRLISGCDGMYTKRKGNFLLVHTADCLPILFFDKKKLIWGVIHSGWRGSYKEIGRKMVRKFLKEGSRVEDILIGMGPCICSNCYKVKEKRAKRFWEKFKTGVKNNFLDLEAINMKQFENLGIKEENILTAGVCTYESNDFFSYRRGDKKEFTGLIGVK